jgi:biotin carboxylase
VVKPASARGGRGIYVVSKNGAGTQSYQGSREIHTDPKTFAREHLAEVARGLPAVVMERLVEPVFDVDMLGWEGRPERVVARRRLSSALPNEGHVIVKDERLERLGTQLIEALKASWLLDCDVMFNDRGEPQVLEINPRASGSVAVTMTAGVPLLDDMISLAKGEPIGEVAIPYGRKVVPYKALAAVGE